MKTKVLVIIASLILIGAPRWISFGYDKIAAPRETTVVANVPETERVRAERPRQITDVAQETPSLANTIKSNLTDGRMRTLRYQFSWGGRGFMTLTVFFFGLVVGRFRFF